MRRKYCDLNVAELPNDPKKLLENVKKLLHLGYHTIAVNRTHELPSKTIKDKKEGKKIAESMKSVLEMILTGLKKYSESPVDDFKLPADFRILSRITIPMNEIAQISYLRHQYFQEIIKGFDLIAIQPENDKVFKIVMEGKTCANIVVISLEQSRFDFDMSAKLMKIGIDAGLKFEICYSKAIKSTSLRKYIFSNAQKLLMKTKHSKGIIMSSGGEHVMDFRSPTDVVMFSSLFGVNESAMHDVVEKNGQQVVLRSFVFKKTFHGALLVEKITEENKNEKISKELCENEKISQESYENESEPDAKKHKLSASEV